MKKIIEENDIYVPIKAGKYTEPDTRLFLACDMCGEPMPEGGPLCVQWCKSDALLYDEKEIEEEVEEVEVL